MNTIFQQFEQKVFKKIGGNRLTLHGNRKRRPCWSRGSGVRSKIQVKKEEANFESPRTGVVVRSPNTTRSGKGSAEGGCRL